MALNLVSKINTRLKFLYRKGKFLSPQLRRLLCNALIQPHSIMHAQFGTPTSIKNSKQSCKLFKTNVYVSVFN